jgi:hypothetical protein
MAFKSQEEQDAFLASLGLREPEQQAPAEPVPEVKEVRPDVVAPELLGTLVGPELFDDDELLKPDGKPDWYAVKASYDRVFARFRAGKDVSSEWKKALHKQIKAAQEQAIAARTGARAGTGAMRRKIATDSAAMREDVGTLATEALIQMSDEDIEQLLAERARRKSKPKTGKKNKPKEA